MPPSLADPVAGKQEGVDVNRHVGIARKPRVKKNK
jgi:hypothetical protein